MLHGRPTTEPPTLLRARARCEPRSLSDPRSHTTTGSRSGCAAARRVTLCISCSPLLGRVVSRCRAHETAGAGVAGPAQPMPGAASAPGNDGGDLVGLQGRVKASQGVRDPPHRRTAERAPVRGKDNDSRAGPGPRASRVPSRGLSGGCGTPRTPRRRRPADDDLGVGVRDAAPNRSVRPWRPASWRAAACRDRAGRPRFGDRTGRPPSESRTAVVRVTAIPRKRRHTSRRVPPPRTASQLSRTTRCR